MRETAMTCSEPEVSASPVNPDGGHLWAIVLAGGEGVRLRPLTRELYGEPRPKQYAALTGSASLLRQTLDRVGRLVPRERTVIVTLASHARYLAPEMSGLEGFHVLAQPSDRGTAAGVLLPVHFIHARDPEATVAVFPVDHFIPEEAAFMRHVAAAAGYAGAHPEWLVLLGAEPTEPEPDYGWIEPGECIGSTQNGPLHRVWTFWEKPPDMARTRLAVRLACGHGAASQLNPSHRSPGEGGRAGAATIGDRGRSSPQEGCCLRCWSDAVLARPGALSRVWLAVTITLPRSCPIFTEVHGTEIVFDPTPSVPPVAMTMLVIRPSLGSIMRRLTLPMSRPSLSRTVPPTRESEPTRMAWGDVGVAGC